MNYLRSSRSVLSTLCCATAIAITGCGDDSALDGTGNGSGGETEQGSGTMNADGTASDGVAPTGNATEGNEGTTTDDPSDTNVDTTSGEETTGEPPGVSCLDDQYVNGPSPGPNYNDFGVPLGTHCQGTDQQTIEGIERVVFLGDSVTVGSRPTGGADFFRTQLANELATLYGIAPPEGLWGQANPLTGQAVVQDSGAFSSCAEWGARNDDLMTQIGQCFSNPDDMQLRTLIIYTSGGNDASNLAQDALDGVPLAERFAELEMAIQFHEEAVLWLTDPANFPNGSFVVNANVYEYTDYTLDLLSCPAAGTVGFNANPDMPEVLLGSLNHMNEEYMRIAEENGTDVVFMFEGFCGHGFHADDPAAPCYRGPGNSNWFDFTCIHPTPEGHTSLADMFLQVISE